MEFKFNNRTYLYDQHTGEVRTSKGVLAKDQKYLTEVALRLINNIEGMEFNFGMNYQTFKTYISVLDEDRKGELFHKIYRAYLYVGDWVNGKGITQTEYYKCMAKMKRYEQYLYIILSS